MGQINNGIAKIELGPKGAAGAMGATLTALGFTTEDTFKINQTDVDKKDYMVEEIDVSLYTSVKSGKLSFTFTLANPDAAALVRVFGGSTTGTGATAVYTAPILQTVIEQSMKITPKIGMGFNIPRVLVTGKYTDSMGRNSLLGVEITCEVLAPETAEPSAPYTTFTVV